MTANNPTHTVYYDGACPLCSGEMQLLMRRNTAGLLAFVDIAAPGQGMYGAINRNYVLDDWTQIVFLYFFGWDGETPYMNGDGTSFAAPLVSGIAGLVRSRFPDLTPGAVAIHMVARGTPVAYDHPIGPLVNAYALA